MRLWKAWLAFGHWIGNIMSWVWFPLFYFTLAFPIALVVKYVKDPLKVRQQKRKSYWTPKAIPVQDLAWARAQGSVSTSSAAPGPSL